MLIVQARASAHDKRNLGQNRVFLVIWWSSENQFGESIKLRATSTRIRILFNFFIKFDKSFIIEAMQLKEKESTNSS